MKYLLSISLLLYSTLLLAVPARRVKKTITLSDGSRKEVVLRGDENVHFLQASDGTMYTGNESAGYRKVEAREIEQRWQARLNERNELRKAGDKALVTSLRKVAGKKKGLVILVDFNDVNMEISQSEFNDFFNFKGYKRNGMAGSVHDYFYDCSYGQFDLSFDVVGPVKVSKNLSYYGANDSNGDDMYAAEMVGEAVRLADKQGVDFSNYDWDGDGCVDQVYVIFAGYGEANDAPEYTIWPHEYKLSSAASFGDGSGAINLDGVKIDTYACSNELYGTSGSKVDGIGTACHEFSHCLGIPDMYDTSGSNFGMSNWDLMDYGCYGGDGYCPCGYTSYERWFCGWLTPKELNSGSAIKEMKALDEAPEAYIVYNQKNKNEYYLLENRQQVGWHMFDLGHGLLILHVDYNKSVWSANEVNKTANHQRMTIIPADNDLSAEYDSDLVGDTWPGTSNKTALTNTTTPKASLYNANVDGQKLMSKPIENIRENTTLGTLSFDFNGGLPLEVPTDLATKSKSNIGFTATWGAVSHATGYEVELTDNDPNVEEKAELILHEDFAKFKGNGTSSSDIGLKLNDYTSTTGWTGSKVYTTANNEAKIGIGNVIGYITTPTITLTSGNATIVFTVRSYGSDKTSVVVKCGDKSSSPIELEKEETTYSITVNTESSFKVTISAAFANNCRFYISDLKVYDGLWDGESSNIQMRDSLSQMASPQKARTTTVYSTTHCQYTFNGLNPEHIYSYRVRAVADGGKSEWSGSIEVALPSEPQDIALTDGEAYRNEGSILARTLTYTRNFKNTNWQPLYVPFSMSYEDWAAQGLEVAWVNGFYEYDDDKNGEIDRAALEIIKVYPNEGSLIPNYPYLVRSSSTGQKMITLSNAALSPVEENEIDCSTVKTKYHFHGIYSPMSVAELNAKNAYVMSGGALKISASVLNSMRWYMWRESRGEQLLPILNEIKVMVYGEDGEEDALDMVNEDRDNKYFNLMGQRVTPNTKGLLISNGRKYIAR